MLTSFYGSATELFLIAPRIWAFLNLWLACGSPFTKMTEITKAAESDESDKDNSDSHKQEVECWISRHLRNHGHDENHGHPGCKPRQTTGFEIPEEGGGWFRHSWICIFGAKMLILTSFEDHNSLNEEARPPKLHFSWKCYDRKAKIK